MVFFLLFFFLWTERTVLRDMPAVIQCIIKSSGAKGSGAVVRIRRREAGSHSSCCHFYRWSHTHLASRRTVTGKRKEIRHILLKNVLWSTERRCVWSYRLHPHSPWRWQSPEWPAWRNATHHLWSSAPWAHNPKLHNTSTVSTWTCRWDLEPNV